MGDHRRISSGGPWEQRIGYSRAVAAGPHVWVSGSTATIEGRLVHPADAYQQTMVALQIIAQALDEAGHQLSDVVRTRIYVARPEDMDEVGRAHGEVFGDIRPAATMLAGISFINPDMLVEIEAESYRGDS